MNNRIKIVLLVLISGIVIWYFLRKMKQKTYLDYLHSLGFGIADKMTFDEQKTAYTYLYSFARKYGANAINILRATDPSLYSKVIALGNKYKIFSLGTETIDSGTNIPNIENPVGVTPIVPNVPIVTAGSPDTGAGKIIPPSLNIV